MNWVFILIRAEPNFGLDEGTAPVQLLSGEVGVFLQAGTGQEMEP